VLVKKIEKAFALPGGERNKLRVSIAFMGKGLRFLQKSRYRASRSFVFPPPRVRE